MTDPGAPIVLVFLCKGVPQQWIADTLTEAQAVLSVLQGSMTPEAFNLYISNLDPAWTQAAVGLLQACLGSAS